MNLLVSTRNLAKKNLTEKQLKLLRKIVEPPFLFSPLSKNSVLILGCQRSGTTLTYLMLKSHHQIRGIDETQSYYSFPHLSILYYHWLRRYVSCFKLPNQTFRLDYITQTCPKTKIVWPVRHPHAVISSMRSFEVGNKNWLNVYAKEELIKAASVFPEILALDLDDLDEISLGAYLWKYKNLILDKFNNSGLNVFVFKYEELLEQPRAVITKMLDFLGLEWSDRPLNYNKYNDARRIYPGGTRDDRPIDRSRKQPKLNLSEGESELVNSICQEQMTIHEY
jgi:hypothetical protein